MKGPQLRHNGYHDLFVGGLASDVTTEDIKEYFASYGAKNAIVMTHTNAAGQSLSKGFGFVTFESEGAMERALAMAPHKVKGKSISARRRDLSGKGGKGGVSIFVGGLPRTTTVHEATAHVREYFACFGTVTDTNVPETVRTTHDQETLASICFHLLTCSLTY